MTKLAVSNIFVVKQREIIFHIPSICQTGTVLKMSSLCTHARPQWLSPLADSQVNDSLLQIIPHFNEALLQLVAVTYTAFIYTLLYDSPDLVVDGVQIWTVWLPEVRTDEVRCPPLQQLDGNMGAMCWSAVLLKYKRVACDMLIAGSIC